jgi:alanyl-tRNA synthetase
LDCQKENKLHIHIVNKLPRNLNAVVKAKVNLNKRKLTEANHSATHLLHAALRKVLGDHVAQKGSFVNEEYLRFDFSHFSKLTTQEIIAVENLVNIKIREAIPLTERRNVPYKEAMNLGAMALFGEKYGDYVRVITFDKNYSTELCGGTHIANTSAIGLFKITAESSVAAGVRRIEAVTSEAGLKLLNHLQSQLTIVEEMLNHPKELPVAVDRLLKENMQMRQKLEHFEKQQLQGIKNQLIQKVNRGDNRNTLFEKLKLPSAEAAKDLCFQLKAAVDNLYCVIAFDVDGKPGIAVVVSDSLVQDQNMDAALIVRELGKEIQGGGGGQKFFATAGGKYLPGLDAALTKARGF